MRNILYDLRKAKGLTQEKLSKLLNVDRAYYSHMENKNMSSISTDTLCKLSLIYDVSMDYLLKNDISYPTKVGIRVPVLGSIPAGIPVEAVEDIIDFEEIPLKLASSGEIFALKVKGTSMQPRIHNGDIVLVRRQNTAENGDVCVVMVNGYEATLKEIRKSEDGITLIPHNTAFKEMFYSNKDIEELPINIIGKVVELRAKF